MEFNSNNNKGLIWGLLEESNIFKGINNNKYNKVQELLEESIINVNNKYSNFKLIEKNKIVIEDVIFKINKEKEKLIENSKDDKHVELIYTSNDLSEKRKASFNNKLKEQQDNLNTYINPKIPEEMNFKYENDKPIGNDMDRLIAEKMASRERELDVPKISKEAESWINNSKQLNNNIDIVPELIEVNHDKKVKFNLDKEIKNNIMYDNNNVRHDNNNNNEINDNNNAIHDNNANENVKNIFNKLKRKTSDNIIRSNNEAITRNEFEVLKNNQEKILNICNILLEKMN